MTVPTKECIRCGATFEKSPSESVKVWNEKRRFCSKSCVYPPRAHLNCQYCDAPFTVKAYRVAEGAKYCSRACAARARDKGLCSLNYRDRHSAEYRAWRTAIFERDDYTCQKCGVRGATLNADHIKQWAHYPELRFDLDNGRTLCEPCHMATPSWGNRKQKAEVL